MTEPRRAFDHAPLTPWSPYSDGERAAAERVRDVLEQPPWATRVTVVLLLWFYAIQLAVGWPLAFGLPDPTHLGISLATDWVGAQLGMLLPEAVRGGEWFRLLSTTLLHASVLHVVGNALVLWMLGPLVELGFGRAAFLVTWTGAGICGALMSAFVAEHPSLGASGAVLGMLGVVLAYAARHRREVPRPLRGFFLQDVPVMAALVAITSALPFVDWAGHLGGFLFGVAVGLLWPSRLLQGGRPTPVGPAGLAASVVAASLLAATFGQVGARVVRIDAAVPDRDIARVAHAVDEEDWPRVAALADELAARYPSARLLGPWRVQALVAASEFAAAVDAARAVERELPRIRRSDPYWDNTVGWAILRAYPDDRALVDEGLKRARASLARLRSDEAVENTVAWGLHLRGEHAAAERRLRELLGDEGEDDVRSNGFMHVLTLLALHKDAEAAAEYRRFAVIEGGELRAEAEDALRGKGLLPEG